MIKLSEPKLGTLLSSSELLRSHGGSLFFTRSRRMAAQAAAEAPPIENFVGLERGREEVEREIRNTGIETSEVCIESWPGVKN